MKAGCVKSFGDEAKRTSSKVLHYREWKRQPYSICHVLQRRINSRWTGSLFANLRIESGWDEYQTIFGCVARFVNNLEKNKLHVGLE